MMITKLTKALDMMMRLLECEMATLEELQLVKKPIKSKVARHQRIIANAFASLRPFHDSSDPENKSEMIDLIDIAHYGRHGRVRDHLIDMFNVQE